jgi:HEAT repeat protein
MSGEDVDQALLSVVKQGTSADRRAALPRLLKVGNSDALALATELATKGSRSERYDAMRMLGDAGTPKAFQTLLGVASQARGQTRVQALEVLAQSHPSDPSVGQLLTDSLFSGRHEEAQYAAGVLGRIGTEDARQALVTALTGKDANLAAAAANALGQVGMTDSVKAALMSAAQQSPLVKTQVMQQLVQSGAPEGLRLAEELLTSKDTPGASQAVWALAQNGTADARRLIERAIDSKDPAVRSSAISALAQNPDEHSTDTLLRLMHDGDPSVRAQALSSLGQIGGDRAQQAILDATRSGKPEERVAAISGLAMMDDARASQQLASLMRDGDPTVAQAAVTSSYNGGPEVDSALEQLVNDPSTAADLKASAAAQLRARGTDLDDATDAIVTKLAGTGGYGYGGYYPPGMIED